MNTEENRAGARTAQHRTAQASSHTLGLHCVPQVVVLGFFDKYDAEDKKYSAFEAGK